MPDERLTELMARFFTEGSLADSDYDGFFDTYPGLVLIAGSDGLCKRANDAWKDELGYAPVDIVGRPYLELVHPDDELDTSWEAASLLTRRAVHFRNRYRVSGSEADDYRWLTWVASDYAQDRTCAIAKVVTDEEELVELDELACYRATTTRYHRDELDDEGLDTLFESSGHLLMLADEKGVCRRASRSWDRVLGIPPSEIEGKEYAGLVHPDDRKATREAAADLREGDLFHFCNRYTSGAHDHRWLSWRASRYDARGVSHALAKLVDDPGEIFELETALAREREAGCRPA